MRQKIVKYTALIGLLSVIGLLITQNLVHARFIKGGDEVWYSIEQVCTNGIVFTLATKSSLPIRIGAKKYPTNTDVWGGFENFTPNENPILIDGTEVMYSELYTRWWDTALQPGEKVELDGGLGSKFASALVTVENCLAPPEPTPATEAYIASLPKTDLFSDLTQTPISASASCQPVTATLPVTRELIIGDVNVAFYVKFQNTFNAKATLTSPAGTTVTLFDQVTDDPQTDGDAFGGYCSENGAITGSVRDEKPDFILDDDSIFSLTSAAVPFNETAFKPQEALSQFAGENAQGDWTLNICDAQPSSNSGTLECWYLEIEEAYAVYLPLVIK